MLAIKINGFFCGCLAASHIIKEVRALFCDKFYTIKGVRALFYYGVVGGTAAEAQGGKFGRGFFTSAFGKLVAKPLADLTERDQIAGGLAAAVVGGSVSELTGGKFHNGAITNAFQYLYNELGDVDPESELLSQDEQDALARNLAKRGITVIEEGSKIILSKGSTVLGTFSKRTFGRLLGPGIDVLNASAAGGFVNLQVRLNINEFELQGGDFGKFQQFNNLLNRGDPLGVVIGLSAEGFEFRDLARRIDDLR